jgi:hypothetical protein
VAGAKFGWVPSFFDIKRSYGTDLLKGQEEDTGTASVSQKHQVLITLPRPKPTSRPFGNRQFAPNHRLFTRFVRARQTDFPITMHTESMKQISDTHSESLEAVVEPTALFVQEMRASVFGWSPEERHRLVTSVAINPSVPEEVQRLIVTSKNLLIYACFYYPFVVTAMQTAFSALELAIKLKAAQSGSPKKLSGLRQAMDLAIAENWIRDEGLEVPPQEEIRETPEGEPEIVETARARPYVEFLAADYPKTRNDLAHGSGYLHNAGASKVLTVNRLINQIYPD